jgi:hypothetical protein
MGAIRFAASPADRLHDPSWRRATYFTLQVFPPSVVVRIAVPESGGATCAEIQPRSASANEIAIGT